MPIKIPRKKFSRPIAITAILKIVATIGTMRFVDHSVSSESF